ncbi:MAG TPA: DUF3883 domain-containing protein [Usitatibacteraceae bacterium]
MTTWEPLLKSIQAHRSKDARFFKPVCLIAVVDGILIGRLAPQDIHISTAIELFGEYISPLFPERAKLGWRPLWHLSNDGAWEFTSRGHIVTPDQFGSARKPDSLGQLLAKVDHLGVSSAMLPFWKARRDLLALREQLLLMLENDDLPSRQIARKLRDLHLPHSNTVNSVEFGVVKSPVISKGQGFQGNLEARLAVESHATRIAVELLAANGWEVEDVSAKECFDLRCTRNNSVLFVEIKGTTGDGTQIILTRAEVDFAKKNYRAMILIAVSGIKVSVGTGDEIVASGGVAKIIHPWRPSARRLKPISFAYGLDE